ncbi:MAG TPA: cell division protein FtsB [Thiobacillaceae bacterium]|nr:cell division protein FtsB [Thiobacillaceae bacterium]HNU63144.1 cell division protein FtsB [Thiobacillaceae bacterium]
MKALAWVITSLIALLLYAMWLGKGNWFRVWDLDREVAAQQTANQALEARNAQLAAEARDLHSGYDALEERARYELGMVRADEVFFHVMEPGSSPRAEVKHP